MSADTDYLRERTSAFLSSARTQLLRSDDVDDDPEQLVRRVTYIGRAVDDGLDALAKIDQRLTALEQQQTCLPDPDEDD